MPRKREEFVPRCVKCGYNLTGLQDFRCPECGTRFSPVEMFERFEATSFRPRRSLLGVYFVIFVAPVLVSLAAVFIAIWVAATIAGVVALPVFVGLFFLYLGYAARRIVDTVRNMTRANFLVSMIQDGGVGMAVFLQIVPLVVFWFLLIMLLLANPPALIPRFIEVVVESNQLA